MVVEVSSQKAAVPRCSLTAAGEQATPTLRLQHRCVTSPDAVGREFGQASAGGSDPVGVGGARAVGLQVPGLGAPRWLHSPAGVLEGTAGPLPVQLVSLRGPLQAGGWPSVAQDSDRARASFRSSERPGGEPVITRPPAALQRPDSLQGLPSGRPLPVPVRGIAWTPS